MKNTLSKTSKLKRGIVTALLFVACAAGYGYHLFTHFMVTAPPHLVAVSDQWPEPLQALIASVPTLQQSVRVYKYDAFVNQKSVWRINGHADSIRDFIVSQSLEAVTEKHPQVQVLLDLVPESWAAPEISTSTFHTTRGYGSEHQEGVDLLLVVRDIESDITFVLHECIF